MDIELARDLIEAIEIAGGKSEIYENYSGRGMFGKTTTGVVVSDLNDLLAGLYWLGRNDERFHIELRDGDIFDFHIDNLGKKLIVY